MTNKRKPLDFEHIRAQAAGNYIDRIFPAVGITFAKAPHLHQPCPLCGGKDRFRCDDKDGTGSWICNQCGAGNGFSLVREYTGNDAYNAHALIAEVLGIDGDKAVSEADKQAWAKERAKRQSADKQAKHESRKVAANTASQRWQTAVAANPHHGYLAKKGIQSHGLRVDKFGNLLIPLYYHNTNTGNITLCNIQSIDKDGKKLFIKDGLVSGAFYTLGDVLSSDTIFVCEGYATAASIYEAIGRHHPVIATFNADNMVKCASIIRALYPQHRLIFCADDDRATAQKTGKNAGIDAGRRASTIAQAEYISPDFGDDDRTATGELTDYNDLHMAFGIEVIKAQLLHAINHPKPIAKQQDKSAITIEIMLKDCAQIVNDRKGSMTNKIYHEPTLTDYTLTSFSRNFGKELAKIWLEHPKKRQINQTDIDKQRHENAKRAFGYIFENYVYIAGTKDVYNIEDNIRQSVESLRLEYPNDFDMWNKSPDRLKVKAENIFFDPTERRSSKLSVPYINTFKGMALTAAKAPLDELAEQAKPFLDLLKHLCNGSEIYTNWVLNWLAIPLQNPGTKMDTFLLFHGHVQGAGKSLFFDRVMSRIYGDYLLTLGQGQLDSQYNDWVEGKLFAVFEEIFQGKERYSQAGMVKQLTTGKDLWISKKFVSGWKQDNFVNSVFLSNDDHPLSADEVDRRAFVMYPKSPLPDDIKNRVSAALGDTDAAALRAFYAFLLNKDTGEQNQHTHAITTPDKEQLINLSRASWERFYNEWKHGMIPNVPYQTCTSQDIFDVYRAWCGYNNEKTTTQTKLMTYLGRRESKELVRFVDYIFGINNQTESYVVRAMVLVINLPEPQIGEMAKSRQKILSDEIYNFRKMIKKYIPRGN
ncbi:putative DNA primase/helicase [Moraxella cuniculi DSM 21768]|uniref:Putative DNA primase/helicase n=1 Tax=Moraxella cuniculi DSM 21768 TaxID=1122245 RepID=A0A1N7DPI7_9GAMM|nr:primase-helicase zinc-binding domain-containing protein [Moraxella cuniculi]OOS05972.1 hypothetical protein B0189_05770 [Moraxella cuniculi]SIR77681.1 putative DNA primase/helicase [Moraxella cuniculi DSM 21768]